MPDTAVVADAEAAIRAAAIAYCEALHRADAAAVAEVFHEASHLYTVTGEGALIDWPRPVFLERVGGRAPADGTPDYTIDAITVTGEMALVRLHVQVGERRFEDHLNFLLVEGTWRMIAKICRVADGPAL
ncbi:MAG: nuclear transport factor 2 family protein [Pseudomonadota bacterium]